MLLRNTSKLCSRKARRACEKKSEDDGLRQTDAVMHLLRRGAVAQGISMLLQHKAPLLSFARVVCTGSLLFRQLYSRTKLMFCFCIFKFKWIKNSELVFYGKSWKVLFHSLVGKKYRTKCRRSPVQTIPYRLMRLHRWRPCGVTWDAVPEQTWLLKPLPTPRLCLLPIVHDWFLVEWQNSNSGHVM